MPITKNGDNEIEYTEPRNKQRSDATGTAVDDEFAIIDQTNVLKQVRFNILPTNDNPGVLTFNCSIGADASIDLTAGAVATSWGAISGTLSNQTDLQTALNAKQNSLGFTAEDSANKDTDGALAANSDVKYASQKATKTYADTKQPALGFTPEDVANKDTDVTLAADSDTKYASQKAIKAYVGSSIGAIELDDLSDVDAAAPSDGQALAWSDDDTAWIASSLPGKATTELDNLGGTSINADLLPSNDGFAAGDKKLGDGTHGWAGAYINKILQADDGTVIDFPNRKINDSAGSNRIDWEAGKLKGFSEEELLTFYSGVVVLNAGADFNAQTAFNAADPTNPQDLTTKIWVEANTLASVFEDAAPQLGGNLTTNDRVIMGNLFRSANAAPTTAVVEQYIHSTTLTASQVAAVASNFTFAHATYNGVEISYIIKEATTNAVRQGRLRIATDGSTATIDDAGSTQTADVGVVWTVGVNGANVEVKYTTTPNNKTMRADVKRFLA